MTANNDEMQIYTRYFVPPSLKWALSGGGLTRVMHDAAKRRLVWNIKAEKGSQSAEREPPAPPRRDSADPQRTHWLTGRFFLDRSRLGCITFCWFGIEATVVLWSQSWSETTWLGVKEGDAQISVVTANKTAGATMLCARTVSSCPPSSSPWWPSAPSRCYKHLPNVEICMSLLSRNVCQSDHLPLTRAPPVRT